MGTGSSPQMAPGGALAGRGLSPQVAQQMSKAGVLQEWLKTVGAKGAQFAGEGAYPAARAVAPAAARSIAPSAIGAAGEALGGAISGDILGGLGARGLAGAALGSGARALGGPVGLALGMAPMAYEGAGALMAKEEADKFASENNPENYRQRGTAAGQRANARAPKQTVADFGNEPMEITAGQEEMQMEPMEITAGQGYTVRAGDTLSAIAGAMLGPEASPQEILAFAKQLQQDIGLQDERKLGIGTNIPGAASGLQVKQQRRMPPPPSKSNPIAAAGGGGGKPKRGPRNATQDPTEFPKF